VTAGDPTETDEVDAIVAAWQRERPDLDVEPMRVLSRVTRLARHLDRVRSRAFAAHQLESWEFDVLAALRRTGEPYRLTPGQLIKQTLVTSGTMTNRVDRLSARGLVSREVHPEDRRGVLVTLTPAGQEQVDAALADLLTAEREIMADLGDADGEQLAGSLRRLLLRYSESGETS
jgi:DNA-binding MarR family transcriptional regulator